jgi:hypothetical protein
MRLRYPGEVELWRGGANEGEGRGFDNLDLSAAGERTISAVERADTVVAWFVEKLEGLGWTHQGGGWLYRDEGESFFARIDRDRGVSRVARVISDPANRQLHEAFEASYYAGESDPSSVVSLFYTVAPESDPPGRL